MRDCIYFLAPKRGGGWTVKRVVEHGPYHATRPKTWLGPFASALDAMRAKPEDTFDAASWHLVRTRT